MTMRLQIIDLTIRSRDVVLVEGFCAEIRTNAPLTLLGESGAGKSLVAQAIMGNLPDGIVASGRILRDGRDLLSVAPQVRRRDWGRNIGLLPQEPWSALDPTMRAQEQVAEVHRVVHGRAAAAARAASASDLTEVALGEAGRLYPFELSGGMCQRLALAIVHAAGSPILLVDEPSKGLDQTLRSELILRLRREVEAGRLVLIITHDVALARALSGTLAVMREGRCCESGPTGEVLAAPRHVYTRALIAADPETWPKRRPGSPGATILEGRGLAKSYGLRALFRDFDITIRSGEIVAIAGPSGSGKTTLGNVLLGLRPPERGTVHRPRNIPAVRFQKLYQDPPAAFAARRTLRDALADLIRLHRLDASRVAALLERLRLADALLDRRPSQISGGELQRFALARVLLLDPVFLFADEITSRLDPVNQKEVMDLLRTAVESTGLAVLLVTHDHLLADRLADRTIWLTP